VSTGAAFARHKNDGVYRTPDDFRAAVVARFGTPSVDLACDETNQFGTLGVGLPIDSLREDWVQWRNAGAKRQLGPKWYETPVTFPPMWLNPPFGAIWPWARKASESGARVLMLVPASIGSDWFRDYVFGRARVYALNGRLCFNGIDPYPKDCILCDYGDEPGLEIWTWRATKK
jgi:hypothetical protein